MLGIFPEDIYHVKISSGKIPRTKSLKFSERRVVKWYSANCAKEHKE